MGVGGGNSSTAEAGVGCREDTVWARSKWPSVNKDILKKDSYHVPRDLVLCRGVVSAARKGLLVGFVHGYESVLPVIGRSGFVA